MHHDPSPPDPAASTLPASPSRATSPLASGEHLVELSYNEQPRSALVYVPSCYDGTEALPLVLAFHGGATDAAYMRDFSQLSVKAEAAGFIVCYPNGSGRRPGMYTFNGGNCCGYAVRRQIDDVGFVAALLDHLQSRLAIDRRAIHATGISNGAVMSYRLASELSQRIASICPVGGPMGFATCAPQRAVSVLHFHGTADGYAPHTGGIGPQSLHRPTFFSVEHTIAQWVAANGCSSVPAESLLAEGRDDGLPVRSWRYAGGREGSEVVLVLVEGGGHTWPGSLPSFEPLGRSTLAVSANDLMWDFFRRHRL